tara:strand:- start:1005 stop:1694 length:690 start_codon:yes stop_codon:yes gene_type:complete
MNANKKEKKRLKPTRVTTQDTHPAPTPLLPQDTDKLETDIRNGVSSIATTASQLSHSTRKLTPQDADELAEGLENLMRECTAVKQKAETLSKALSDEEVANKLRVEKAEAARPQFKPVPVEELSLLAAIRNRTDSKDRGANAAIWQCSGADADGTCRVGKRDFAAHAKKSNVENHITRIHDSTPASRARLAYQLLGNFVDSSTPEEKEKESTGEVTVANVSTCQPCAKR